MGHGTENLPAGCWNSGSNLLRTLQPFPAIYYDLLANCTARMVYIGYQYFLLILRAIDNQKINRLDLYDIYSLPFYIPKKKIQHTTYSTDPVSCHWKQRPSELPKKKKEKKNFSNAGQKSYNQKFTIQLELGTISLIFPIFTSTISRGRRFFYVV